MPPRADTPPAALNQYTQRECKAAIYRLVSGKRERWESYNQHLSAQERQDFVASCYQASFDPKSMQDYPLTPINWPSGPVFTYYREVHHGYTQLPVKSTRRGMINNDQYTHRVAYRAHTGNDLDLDLECSHVLSLGAATGRNINPLHLTLEKGEINKSRRGCHLAIEVLCRNAFEGGLPDTAAAYEALDRAILERIHGCCSVIHSHALCQVNSRAFRKIVAQGQDMAGTESSASSVQEGSSSKRPSSPLKKISGLFKRKK